MACSFASSCAGLQTWRGKLRNGQASKAEERPLWAGYRSLISEPDVESICLQVDVYFRRVASFCRGHVGFLNTNGCTGRNVRPAGSRRASLQGRAVSIRCHGSRTHQGECCLLLVWVAQGVRKFYVAHGLETRARRFRDVHFVALHLSTMTLCLSPTLQGNKRTPERFVGREAVITNQCLNGWWGIEDKAWFLAMQTVNSC